MSPASPSWGRYHSQGVDQSSLLLISHLPLATSHERKYFVGILSSPSLRARLPFFFQFLLITHVPVWPHWPLLRKSHANLAGNMEACGVRILSFWSQGLFWTSPFLSCLLGACVYVHACVLRGGGEWGGRVRDAFNIQCVYICMRSQPNCIILEIVSNTYIHAIYHRTVVCLISDSLSQSEGPNARWGRGVGRLSCAFSWPQLVRRLHLRTHISLQITDFLVVFIPRPASIRIYKLSQNMK